MDGWTQTLSAQTLLGISAAAIILILILIVKFRIHALLTLVIVSLLTALATGLPTGSIVNDVLVKNFGGTLGGVALLVGLGAMLGRLVETSGGAQSLADALIRMFGEKRAPFALGVASLIFGFPIFFDAGLIVMLPIVFATARRMKQDVLPFALASIGAFSVMHVFLPPHPGPIAASEFYGANIGQVLILGLPTAFITWYFSGYMLGKVLGCTIHVPVPELLSGGTQDNDLPKEPAERTCQSRNGRRHHADSHAADFPEYRRIGPHQRKTRKCGRNLGSDGKNNRFDTDRPSDFRIGRTVCLGTQTRRKRQRVGKNRGRRTRPRLFRDSDYRRGRYVRRRFARFRHRQGTRRQHGGFGHSRPFGLFPCRLGTAYRARFGNRRPDHRRRADGSCRCRRRLYRLAARLYRIGNGGRFGRLQPLQRLRLLTGRPPLGHGRTDHAENLDGQPNPHRTHRLCLVRTAVRHRLTDGKDSK